MTTLEKVTTKLGYILLRDDLHQVAEVAIAMERERCAEIARSWEPPGAFRLRDELQKLAQAIESDTDVELFHPRETAIATVIELYRDHIVDKLTARVILRGLFALPWQIENLSHSPPTEN